MTMIQGIASDDIIDDVFMINATGQAGGIFLPLSGEENQ